jgi:hypothetical protein
VTILISASRRRATGLSHVPVGDRTQPNRDLFRPVEKMSPRSALLPSRGSPPAEIGLLLWRSAVPMVPSEIVWGPYWVLIGEAQEFDAEPITDLDFELEAIRRADFTRMRNWVAATGDATVKIVRKVSD